LGSGSVNVAVSQSRQNLIVKSEVAEKKEKTTEAERNLHLGFDQALDKEVVNFDAEFELGSDKTGSNVAVYLYLFILNA
jgi:hypothetical protein